MSEAQYLNIALELGLSRREALAMEMRTVFEMVEMRNEAAKEARERARRM